MGTFGCMLFLDSNNDIVLHVVHSCVTRRKTNNSINFHEYPINLYQETNTVLRTLASHTPLTQEGVAGHGAWARLGMSMHELGSCDIVGVTRLASFPGPGESWPYQLMMSC